MLPPLVMSPFFEGRNQWEGFWVLLGNRMMRILVVGLRLGGLLVSLVRLGGGQVGNPREQFLRLPVPGVEEIDALADDCCGFGGGFGLFEQLRDVVELGFAAGEVGADGVVEEAAEEGADAGFGGVEGAAVTGDVDGVDGFEFLQILQALGGGAFADLQAVDDLGEADRRGGGEEQAEDFAEGAGQAEGVGEVDEELDELPFDRRQCGGGSLWRCVGGRVERHGAAREESA